MRRPFILFVLSVSTLSFSSWVATAERWREAYTAGVKATKEKQWQAAERQLKVALSERSEEKGADREYIPHYYLGIAYLNQNKSEPALEAFRVAEKLGLEVKAPSFYRVMRHLKDVRIPHDLSKKWLRESESFHSEVRLALEKRDFPAASERLQSARSKFTQADDTLKSVQRLDAASSFAVQLTDLSKELQTLKQKLDQSDREIAVNLNRPAVAQQAPTTSTPPKEQKPVVESPQPKKQQDLTTYEIKIRSAIAAKQYPVARNYVQQARVAGLEQAVAGQFLNTIDISEAVDNVEAAILRRERAEAERLVRKLIVTDPKNQNAELFRRRIQELPDDGSEETIRRGIVAFYRGLYQESISYLDQAAIMMKPVSANNDSLALIYFFRGCSKAALGVMASGNESQKLLAEAREQFVRSKRFNPSLSFDRKNIPPKILQLYDRSM